MSLQTPLKNVFAGEKAVLMFFHACENNFLNQLPTDENTFFILLQTLLKKISGFFQISLIKFKAS